MKKLLCKYLNIHTWVDSTITLKVAESLIYATKCKHCGAVNFDISDEIRNVLGDNNERTL